MATIFNWDLPTSNVVISEEETQHAPLVINEKNIPKTGSMKYNSANIMPYRQEIDKLVDKLLEKDDINKLYKKYREMLEKEKEMFDNRYFSKEESKEQNKSIENKEKELHDRIANMILQNIKCYREDVEEYEQEQEDELYIDNTSETVSEHAKVSMKNRSRCLSCYRFEW